MWRFLQIALAGSAAAATFQWDDVAPNHDLEYHDCYDGFQCARLILPIDWKNESNEATVEIAITKLRAVVNDTDPSYGGPIFTNPGGPGGSGVSYILLVGQALRNIVDIPGKRHYDIISFDPRGIGRSTPTINCYSTGLLERAASGLETHGNGPLDSSIAALQYGLALTDAESRRCAAANGDFLSYVGTSNVARDMVAMVDKIDEGWRKSLGESAQMKDGEEKQSRLELRSTIEDNRNHDVPRLQYIGFSYGTILGNYFASLFPERIGRIILDGVCNTDDYANGAVSHISQLVSQSKLTLSSIGVAD
jgi:pimeloyl-ACP methyl ester carboxylesterase